MLYDNITHKTPNFNTGELLHFLIVNKTVLFNKYNLQIENIFSNIRLDESYNNFTNREKQALSLKIITDFAELMFIYQYFQLDIDKNLDTYPIYDIFNIDIIKHKYRDSFINLYELFNLYGFNITNKTVNYNIIINLINP
jgi:hypothetical protein